ncbi:cytochrome P450 [Aliiroseovarius subalbicans]|uniref:cytochrome P450 n=1 Tax=Aliiroseovarius subalbicans TaxID=2925840 RepID=UPI001F5826C9|nr:cytochrome P450 [Aliiroseovarius subalbicans]MCI2399693.1 cytochrome P450 [Aliiroseovarius subalbicans]
MTQDHLPVRVPLARERRGFLHVLAQARRNALAIIPEIATQQPIVSGKMVRRFHMVMDPESLRNILKDRADDYPKSPEALNILRPALGSGLFSAIGEHWRWQRRAAAPVFTRRNVEQLTPVMTEAAQAAVTRLGAQAADGPVDMAAEMLRTAFEVIAAVTFSHKTGIPRDLAHRAIENYLTGAGRVSLFDFLGLPDWVPRPDRLVPASELRRLKRAADDAIDAHAARALDEVPDLLDLLIDAQDPETGRRMTTPELRDNLLTMLVAGHETTALALSWSFYLCAFDTDVQERARAEAHEVLNGRIATGDDVVNLPYTRQIVEEAMRLYPPAGFLSRTATAPDMLQDREVLPGDTIMLPIYALHRNRLWWTDPDRFDPDRFEDPRAIDPFAYLPFGGGPRICLGMSFAMQETVIVLSTLLSRFRFTPVPGRVPEPVLILSLRPGGGVWLNLEPI